MQQPGHVAEALSLSSPSHEKYSEGVRPGASLPSGVKASATHSSKTKQTDDGDDDYDPAEGATNAEAAAAIKAGTKVSARVAEIQVRHACLCT